MSDLPQLTQRQQQVYDFIEEKIQEWGYPPTISSLLYCILFNFILLPYLIARYLLYFHFILPHSTLSQTESSRNPSTLLGVFEGDINADRENTAT